MGFDCFHSFILKRIWRVKGNPILDSRPNKFRDQSISFNHHNRVAIDGVRGSVAATRSASSERLSSTTILNIILTRHHGIITPYCSDTASVSELPGSPPLSAS